MKTTELGFIRTIGVFVLAILANGCSARTIVDENDKPLAGVHVVAEWRGAAHFYGTTYACFRVETMVTAEDGKFDFPYFSGNFNPVFLERKMDLLYFKPGYELVRNQVENANSVKMRPFSGDLKRRFAPDAFGDYSVFNEHSACPESRKKLYPVLLAVHLDAKQLATTFEQRSRVIDFEYLLETIPKEGVDGEGASLKSALERADAKRSRLAKEVGANQ